jgi:RNA polymerase-interacting CarD/CdnL/TRCF family regulator
VPTFIQTGDVKEVEEMVRKLYAKKNGDKSVQVDKKVLREMVERFR